MDESEVNTGLIIFLETVGNLYLASAASECHWELAHIDVGTAFNRGLENSYTTKVGGTLWSRKDHGVMVIAEVKRAQRDRGYNAIVKEEVCQMADFLRTTADTDLPLKGQ